MQFKLKCMNYLECVPDVFYVIESKVRVGYQHQWNSVITTRSGLKDVFMRDFLY